MPNSVYIHIPFCSNICTYCDFSKVFYKKELVDKYLIALTEEIFTNYKDNLIETIYIGGGTPSSLSIEQLKILFKILKTFKVKEDCEISFECNIEDTSLEKLRLLFNNGINRISFGVQSFNSKKLEFLGRKHNKEDIIEVIKNAREVGFNNITMDMIYGLNFETKEMLEEDINNYLTLNPEHISLYSLIIEPHTKLFIDKVKSKDEDTEADFYELICDRLNSKEYEHYEISNFGKKGFASKHNLVYWKNLNYYGFGLGAHGYIDNVRYENVKSLNIYLSGKSRLKEEYLSKKEVIFNEIMLGLRLCKGINILKLDKKYDIDFYKEFNVESLLKNGLLDKNDGNIYIPEKHLYISNEIILKLFDGYDKLE